MRQRIAKAAVVVVLGITAVAYGALEKHVTVRVDGSEMSVRTFAGTVADTLVRAGVAIDPKDSVTPALDTGVSEGDVIVVRRAKSITLLLNGRPRQVIVTGLTVEEVIHEMSLRGALTDFVGASRSAHVTEGMVLEYREAIGISVAHDGVTDQVITNAGSVGQILSELGVVLGAADKVTPTTESYPFAGMMIRVLRVGERIETEERAIAPRTITRSDSNMERGRREIRQRGTPGVALVTYRSTYEDGKRVARKVVSERTLRAATPTVIAVGAGPRCVCTRGAQSGKATWYGASGLIAAHMTLPFGTVVKVTNLENGRTVTVTIRDRGPTGEGRIIDLSDDAFSRIAGLGEGIVPVQIRW